MGYASARKQSNQIGKSWWQTNGIFIAKKKVFFLRHGLSYNLYFWVIVKSYLPKDIFVFEMDSLSCHKWNKNQKVWQMDCHHSWSKTNLFTPSTNFSSILGNYLVFNHTPLKDNLTGNSLITLLVNVTVTVT